MRNGKRPALGHAPAPPCSGPYRIPLLSFRQMRTSMDPVLAGGFDHSYWHQRFRPLVSIPRSIPFDDQPLALVKPDSGYYSTTAIAQHAIEMPRESPGRTSRPAIFSLSGLPLAAFTAARFAGGYSPLPRPLPAPAGMPCAAGTIPYACKNWESSTVSLSPSRDPDIIPWWNLPEQELREKIGPGEVGHALPWNDLTERDRRNFNRPK